MGRNMNIYVTDEQVEKMKSLHKKLGERGVHLNDNRGNASDSKLIRELIRLADADELVKALKPKGESDGN